MAVGMLFVANIQMAVHVLNLTARVATLERQIGENLNETS